TAAAGWKYRSVPGEQPLSRERLVIFLSGIEHHLDHALDISVGWRESARIYAEPPGDRRTHLLLIEDFALDFARLDHVFSHRVQPGFSPQGEAERLHATDESSLPMADLPQRTG